jgi:hypothetical protein
MPTINSFVSVLLMFSVSSNLLPSGVDLILGNKKKSGIHEENMGSDDKISA